MLRHDTGGFAATTAPQGFGLEDFERAGIRVVEWRFKAKDTIFAPGDPDDQLYFLLKGVLRVYTRSTATTRRRRLRSSGTVGFSAS
jgi:CRP-like cAMP-binding protein